jgi:hypothetical protein
MVVLLGVVPVVVALWCERMRKATLYARKKVKMEKEKEISISLTLSVS